MKSLLIWCFWISVICYIGRKIAGMYEMHMIKKLLNDQDKRAEAMFPYKNENPDEDEF